jgi:hypothetical protein
VLHDAIKASLQAMYLLQKMVHPDSPLFQTTAILWEGAVSEGQQGCKPREVAGQTGKS